MSASALALGMSTALADQHQANNTTTAQAADKKAPSFLFVVSAKKAQLKPGKDGNMLLVINKSDLGRTIEFSDRPYRIVKYLTPNVLFSDGSKGKNSFVADPPNAVLSAEDMKPQIVVVNGMKLSDSDLTFKLQGHHLTSEGALPEVVLTVDSCTCTSNDCSYCCNQTGRC